MTWHINKSSAIENEHHTILDSTIKGWSNDCTVHCIHAHKMCKCKRMTRSTLVASIRPHHVPYIYWQRLNKAITVLLSSIYRAQTSFKFQPKKNEFPDNLWETIAVEKKNSNILNHITNKLSMLFTRDFFPVIYD